jgi:hypothetical protein
MTVAIWVGFLAGRFVFAWKESDDTSGMTVSVVREI